MINISLLCLFWAAFCPFLFLNLETAFNSKSLYFTEKELKKSTLLHPTFSSLNEESNILQKSLSLKYTLKNLSIEDGSNLHSRKKRFLSYPRYVEVMVTADTKMVRHHGQNVQHYILTLMSIVSKLKFINMSNFSYFCSVVFRSATSLSSGLTEFCIKWDSININKKSRAKTSDYVSFQFNAVRCVGEKLWPISWFAVALEEFLSFSELNIWMNYSRQRLKGTVKKNARL